MKTLTLLLLMTAFATTTHVESVALQEEKVQRAQAIIYMGECYVALICEPIYVRSENKAICARVEQNITSQCRLKANVVIDVGLYFEIQRIKSLEEKQKNREIQSLISKFSKRCNYERSQYY